MEYTIEMFEKADQCFPIGSFVFLPLIPTLTLTEKACGIKQLRAFMQTAGFLSDGIHPTLLVHRLCEEYKSRCGLNGFPAGPKEPAWIHDAPAYVRRFIRHGYAITDGTDPHSIVPVVPFAGFGYVLQDFGMLPELAHAIGFERLRHVRQLAFLHPPFGQEDLTSPRIFVTFHHTRLYHTVNAVAFAALIAANNDRALTIEEKKHLLAAVLSHDILTPAGGDTTKLIDPQAFDEDAHYPKIFMRRGAAWKAFNKKYGLDEAALHLVIKNGGPLGAILDLADKLSYIGLDVKALLGNTISDRRCRLKPRYMEEIRHDVSADPFICGLWQSAEIRDGALVIHDVDRLCRFLKLRAKMFRYFYHNPFSRMFEYVIARVIISCMYREGVLGWDDLVEKTDTWLEREIEKYCGVEDVLTRMDYFAEESAVYQCRTFAEAKLRASGLARADSKLLVIIDSMPTAVSPGWKRFLVPKGNGSQPFAEAVPETAREIKQILGSRSKRFEAFVITIPFDRLGVKKELWGKLREYGLRPIAGG